MPASILSLSLAPQGGLSSVTCWWPQRRLLTDLPFFLRDLNRVPSPLLTHSCPGEMGCFCWLPPDRGKELIQNKSKQVSKRGQWLSLYTMSPSLIIGRSWGPQWSSLWSEVTRDCAEGPRRKCSHRPSKVPSLYHVPSQPTMAKCKPSKGRSTVPRTLRAWPEA